MADQPVRSIVMACSGLETCQHPGDEPSFNERECGESKLQDVGRQLQVGGSNNQLKVWAVSAIQLTCMLLSNSIGIAHFPFTHTTDKSEKNTTLYCHES